MKKIKSWTVQLKKRARLLKREALALIYAYRDARTPWYARLFAALIVAQILSPIDLIPDFIPILGYLDDLILVPLMIGLAIKMIPLDVRAEARQKASQYEAGERPIKWVYAVFVVLVWLGVAFLVIRALWKAFSGG
jgi:uncharacterized membrane protein YkvA (DUF1232 family)